MGDINRGLLKFTPDGKVAVVLREAGHFLAVDAARKFTRMDFQQSEHWPRWFKHRDPPGSELALISDGGSPPLIHRDGNLYYVATDDQMVPGGLQIGRLSPDGKLALVAPPLSARAKERGGITGLASGIGRFALRRDSECCPESEARRHFHDREAIDCSPGL